MTPLRRLAAGLSRFWSGLITTPIRDGRLRDTGWPVGLRPIVVVGVVAFALAVLLILLAPAIRAALPLSVTVGATVLSLPRLVLPTIFWLIILSIALVQSAALHVRARTAAVLTVMTVLVVLFLGSLDLGSDGEGGLGVTPGKVVSVVVASVIVALTVLRHRRDFAWWEFPLMLALVAGAAVVALGRSAQQSAAFGLDFGPPTASLVMSSIGQLAVPAALAAGVAVAEFAITASTAAVAAVQRPGAAPEETPLARLGLRAVPLVLLVAFLAVALWRVIELVVALLLGLGVAIEPGDLPLSAALIGLVALLWWVLARLRGGSAARIGTVMTHLDAVAFPVAVALTVTLAPLVALLLGVQVLSAWGLDPATTGGALAVADALRSSVALSVVRLGVGLGLIVLALLLARRGGRGAPELMAAIGVMAILSAGPALLETRLPWSSPALATVVALATLVLAAVLAVRRQLDSRRLALLLTALLLSAAAAWRDVLADPLSAVIGASGLALVLFGFVWGFLTDADITHGDSRAYPRPARVLLFLANAVFGVTVLAYGALARSVDAGIDLDAFAQFGDQLLGTAVILAAVMAVWAAAVSADSRPARATVGP
ncbi:hypothetical protein [Microcella frigidaquae]|uniref:Uncharacterized protein n=1 Tax=Microcella frigidaquae TaxID=424758 RepID=A0A840X795_9MICO|nr:hypothetical protein [Microcella frigidaquae]MBB5617074.1 hypothetical protein [Microcella frigidaquae]NHN45279.1 hypothetical protein [Microcella frigidaquae]